MGLTSSLYSGLSGLNANQFRIDTIGDNIANANTTGFKGSRSMFQTQFAQLLSQGTPPGTNTGGTNGLEVGLGAVVGATQRNMMQGSTETTGLAGDMAIDGEGFFVVRTSSGGQAYTRDGSFMLNSDNYLVSADGSYLQGFGIDENGNTVPGVLGDLRIPMGQLASAKATTTAKVQGNLSSADQPVVVQGNVLQTGKLVSGGGVATGATALNDLRTAGKPADKLFADGDVITASSMTKGGHGIATNTFTVGTDGTTVDDFMTWLQGTLGINMDASVPGTPGVTIDADGIINIAGNVGMANSISIDATDIVNTTAGNIAPFTFSRAVDAGGVPISATGNSVYTPFTAFDSLGTPITVNLTMVLEKKGDPAGNIWRYYAESPQNTGTTDRCIGTGTFTIDSMTGMAVPGSTAKIQIDRAGTGAAGPVVIDLDLSGLSGLDSAGSGNLKSTLNVPLQNGFGPGQLDSYSIGTDGVISGTFSNGLSQTLGQIVVGTFANPAGLVRQTNNVYTSGPNSGQVAISTPDSMGAGRILSGALELSNVDLSREFIGLINASSGFSAASKVITTSNQLLNDLLMLMR